VACVVVSAWERELDRSRLDGQMRGAPPEVAAA
jgi:hypothetical protein